jgi:DNA-binding beta-propeller fold protein YncE
VALLAAVLVACAGCASSPARVAQSIPSPAADSGFIPASGIVTHSIPGCTTATQAAPALPATDASLESVPGAPFGVAVTANGRWAFVSLGATVGVFRIGTARLPALVREAQTPGSVSIGAVLSPGDRYLLIANAATGASVLSPAMAEDGVPREMLGELAVPRQAGGGAIEAAVTPDGRYAFVSLENADAIAVFRLPASGSFGPADYVGSIPTQVAPVGLAVSPDGRWLYSTSEDQSLSSEVGTLTVISVAEATTDPGKAIVARTVAGCNPVRVITSASGSVVWVTARASDALLAFSAARLRTDPAHALLADVRVGQLPVGLALVGAGSLVVVADSDRFHIAGATSSLAVVDVADALAGRPALVGYLPAGGFPREMALEPDGATLLVTNYSSRQLEAVDVAALP